jgi:uncharacterized phage protein (TIGR02218 family)
VKSPPVNLAAHYLQGTTTLAHLLKITRTDGAVYAFTSADADVTISGASGNVTYLSAPGMDVSSIAISAGFAVDNLELTTLDDGTTFTRADVLTGKWRNAAFTLSRYNWQAPADGVDVLMAGTVGEVTINRTSVVAELRGLQQYLQQPIGSVSSKTCRARLGDALCTEALGPWTVTGTLTSVTSQQVFTDSTRAEAADYFTEGLITFTSGACAGLSAKVKTHAAGGVLTLALPVILQLVAGDAYSLVAGCRKRLAEDCAAKFNNVINFQGEPHLPGVDALTK